MKKQRLLIILTSLAASVLIIGIIVASANDSWVSARSDELLRSVGEPIERIFRKVIIGDKIVYFYQRTIDGAIVEKDHIIYYFNENTGELLDKKSHWRWDLPEHLPPIRTNREPIPGVKSIISREEAESRAEGKVQFSELIIISPDSEVYNLKNIPENPCWVVRSVKSDNKIVTIIDAVTTEMLGYGIPPPQIKGFSLSGPMYWNPCWHTWYSWYENAEYWFNLMGYPTEALKWPEEDDIKIHIQSTETVVFYELAHGGSFYFCSGCLSGNWCERTTAIEIEEWIANYTKMPFTFIGSCGGMCNTSDGNLSFEFRKGSEEDTVTVGYCDMAASYCSRCWGRSITWQDQFFESMSKGDTVEEAYNAAMAIAPECFEPEGHGSCMRFAGDPDLTLVPTVYRTPPIEISLDIKPGSYPNSINLKSIGKVPVAILTTDDFDAYDVDPDTCVFANANPLRWKMEDVDNDGDYDMLFHFKTQELDLTKESTEATLKGETYDGMQIIGTDSVKIVPKFKWHSKKGK